MAVINFKQSTTQNIEQSEHWSKRGDSFKSLLYARQAVEDRSQPAMLRMAAALYETGNFAQAAKVYIRLLCESEKSTAIYVGLIKCLVGMSRYRSAGSLVREARSLGLLPEFKGNAAKSRADIENVYNELNRLFPNIAVRENHDMADDDFKRLVYVLGQGTVDIDETLLPDLYLGGTDQAAGEVLFRAASVITSDKLNRQLAQKLLKACDEGLANSGYTRVDIFATKIVAHVALGQYDEAEITAEDLMSMEMPTSYADLLKCAVALTEIGYHDGAVDYFEELTNHIFEERLVFMNAAANLNAGDRERAKELFSEVLVINPNNHVAKYWCKLLSHTDGVCDYEIKLPEVAETKIREQFDHMVEDACDNYSTNETQEMRDIIAYSLRSEEHEYAAFVARSLATIGVYRCCLEDYLLDVAGRLALKREIIADMLFMDSDKPLMAFLFGVKKISVTREFERDLTTPDPIKRIYISALSAFAVYGDDYRRFEEVFDLLLPYLNEQDLRTTVKEDTFAAALTIFGGLEAASNAKDAAFMFVSTTEKKVESLCKELESRFSELRRPKKKTTRKRRG